jgi:hypothetical protein
LCTRELPRVQGARRVQKRQRLDARIGCRPRLSKINTCRRKVVCAVAPHDFQKSERGVRRQRPLCEQVPVEIPDLPGTCGEALKSARHTEAAAARKSQRTNTTVHGIKICGSRARIAERGPTRCTTNRRGVQHCIGLKSLINKYVRRMSAAADRQGECNRHQKGTQRCSLH